MEDKDDISKLVTGLMKTSICRQMSYKTVEGNEVRATLSPCTPFFLGGSKWDSDKAKSLCRPPLYHAAVPALAQWKQWWRRHLTSLHPLPSEERWPAVVRVSNTCLGHPSLPQASCAALADSGADSVCHLLPTAFEDCITTSAIIESAVRLLRTCLSSMPPGKPVGPLWDGAGSCASPSPWDEGMAAIWLLFEVGRGWLLALLTPSASPFSTSGEKSGFPGPPRALCLGEQVGGLLQ